MKLTWDDRLYNWLYDMTIMQGTDRIQMSAAEIAEETGATRRIVFWALARLREREMVKVERSRIGDIRNTIIVLPPRAKMR